MVDHPWKNAWVPPGLLRNHGTFAPRYVRGFTKRKQGFTFSLVFSSELRAQGDRLVNLTELALELRVSRKSLSDWMNRWPDFPVRERGKSGRNYAFDAAEVSAFLQMKRDGEAVAASMRDRQLAQLSSAFAVGMEAPAVGLSVKDRIEAVRLRKLLREEEAASSGLVDAWELGQELVRCTHQLSQAMRHSVCQAAREHQLPDAVVRSLEAKLVDAHRAFVRDAGGLMRQRLPAASQATLGCRSVAIWHQFPDLSPP